MLIYAQNKKDRRYRLPSVWKAPQKREVTLDRGFDMPRSGVTSDDSWYLTSFVILTFYCLSFAFLLSTLKNTNHFKFSMENTVRFFVYIFLAKDEGLYFVEWAVGCRSVLWSCRDFSYPTDLYIKFHTMALQPHTWDRLGMTLPLTVKVVLLKRTLDCSSFT